MLKRFVKLSSRYIQLAGLRVGLKASAVISPRLAQHWGMRIFAQPAGPRRIRYDYNQYPPFHSLRWCFQPRHRQQQQTLQAYGWGQIDTRPTILLIHGWGGWGLQMGPFVNALLRQGLAVITVDMPAHGHSMGRLATLPLWSEAIEHLFTLQPNLVGAICHSFGGGALTYALTHHARSLSSLRRIALLGAPADMELSLMRFGQALGLSASHTAAIQRGWEEKLHLPFSTMRVEAAVVPKQVAALLVYDEDDPVVGLDELARYQRHWPHAQSLMTKKLGHQKILRDPTVIEAVTQFISGSDPCTMMHTDAH
ncbi:alpha/beta fold hydrolase [Parvibium lacunae]|nr:alpha/beta fold hydrolase [Parvibium lacunae]